MHLLFVYCDLIFVNVDQLFFLLIVFLFYSYETLC